MRNRVSSCDRGSTKFSRHGNAIHPEAHQEKPRVHGPRRHVEANGIPPCDRGKAGVYGIFPHPLCEAPLTGNYKADQVHVPALLERL